MLTLTPNTIYQGDAYEVLIGFPDNCIDMCITSPPYWNLRDYKTDGQLGMEQSYDDYITRLIGIYRQVKRVIKPTGSIWVNLGDTFNGMKKGNTNRNQKFEEDSQHIYKQPSKNIPQKSLCMIPERFALRMIGDLQLILRNRIIWHKTNAMPQSAPDRFTIDYEYLYHFTKSKKYYWEQQYRPLSQQSIERIKYGSLKFGGKKAPGYGSRTYSGKEWVVKTIPGMKFNTGKSGKSDDPNKKLHQSYRNREVTVRGPDYGTRGYNNAIKEGWNPEIQDYASWYFEARQGKSWVKHKDDVVHGFHQTKQVPLLDHPYGSKLRSVWSISTAPFKGAHFATFPMKLLEIPIKASCPEQVCMECGVPRTKIIEKEYEIETPNIKHWKHDESNRFGNRRLGKARITGEKIIGYNTCSHNSGFNPGVVFDPFMGSGTTALAALQLNRQFLGIELNQTYIDMANERLNPLLAQQKIV